MIRRILSLALVGVLALAIFAACQSSAPTLSPTAAPTEVSLAAATVAASPTAAAASSPAPTATVVAPATPTESSQAQATVSAPASAAVQIALADDAITVDGDGVTVNGNVATIARAGVYSLSGALSDGQIVVDTTDEGPVQLILDGVKLANASSAPLFIAAAEQVEIVLADGTTNTLTDGATYIFADPEEDEPDGALFSKADLTISGNGALVVTGNYEDGIVSKDGLVIVGGDITVTAADDGIRGKDYLLVTNGIITVQAQGDGLKSSNDEEATKGYVAIENGMITVMAGDDAISAETDVLISNGQFILVSGNGRNPSAEDISAKGIKAGRSITIDDGVFSVEATDDALHANDSLTINGGLFTLASGDDAIHAENTLTINDGEIRITESVEGIESILITINGGVIDLVSSDDGINAAGNDNGSNQLFIHGGDIAVNAAGDGIDVNGSIEMTGGVVIVNGPTENMNGALDFDATFDISGGFLAAAGSAGMAQAPSASSSQRSLMLNFPSMLPAGTIVHIQTGSGDSLLTFAPLKAFQSLVFSSPALVQGDAIEIYYGGSASDRLDSGLYQGAYTPGEQVASFTVSDVVTVIGNRPRFR